MPGSSSGRHSPMTPPIEPARTRPTETNGNLKPAIAAPPNHRLRPRRSRHPMDCSLASPLSSNRRRRKNRIQSGPSRFRRGAPRLQVRFPVRFPGAPRLQVSIGNRNRPSRLPSRNQDRRTQRPSVGREQDKVPPLESKSISWDGSGWIDQGLSGDRYG